MGALLVNLEDVYKATWIPSIFIMTAQEVEICWSREDISAGEQAQAALIQEEEAVTASACMYCQHQHTDRRKALPIHGSLSHWGPWHGCVRIINIYTLGISSVPTQAAPHRGEQKDALEFYK